MVYAWCCARAANTNLHEHDPDTARHPRSTPSDPLRTPPTNMDDVDGQQPSDQSPVIRRPRRRRAADACAHCTSVCFRSASIGQYLPPARDARRTPSRVTHVNKPVPPRQKARDHGLRRGTGIGAALPHTGPAAVRSSPHQLVVSPSLLPIGLYMRHSASLRSPRTSMVVDGEA